jgi:RNA polymerase sigma-70 factor (ECF subfamily)
MDEELERTRVLLERARGGDEEAYDVLFARHRGELERIAHARLPPSVRQRVDASDVVQECELAALESFEEFEYRGPGSFRHWLQRILENRLFLMQRFHGRSRREVAREVALEAPSEERSPDRRAGVLADSATSPSNRASAEERRARLRARLAWLPDDQRRVLELVKLEERSVSEAARLLGRSENAVKKLLARALLRLRSELRDEGLGESR